MRSVAEIGCNNTMDGGRVCQRNINTVGPLVKMTPPGQREASYE
jgi:hypothetical protein